MGSAEAGKYTGKGNVDTQIEGEEMRIRIGGDFGVSLAPEVQNAIKHGINAGISSMVIDLRNVDYIDSSGIGTLVMAFKGLTRTGGKLRVLGIPEQAKKLLNFPPFTDDGELKPEVFVD